MVAKANDNAFIFNESGIIASCIDEDGKTFSFLKIAKNQFIKLDIEKTK